MIQEDLWIIYKHAHLQKPSLLPITATVSISFREERVLCPSPRSNLTQHDTFLPRLVLYNSILMTRCRKVLIEELPLPFLNNILSNISMNLSGVVGNFALPPLWGTKMGRWELPFFWLALKIWVSVLSLFNWSKRLVLSSALENSSPTKG